MIVLLRLTFFPHTEFGGRADYSRCGECRKADIPQAKGSLGWRRSKDQERRGAVWQHAGSAAISASSMMRRIVRAHRPHWALQPRQ
jgi:hypothetical protein